MQYRTGSTLTNASFHLYIFLIMISALMMISAWLIAANATKKERSQQESPQVNHAQQELLKEINQLRQKVAPELVLIQSRLSDKNSIPENDLRKADLLSRTAIQLLMAEGYVLNENLADAERFLKNAKEKWREYGTSTGK